MKSRVCDKDSIPLTDKSLKPNSFRSTFLPSHTLWVTLYFTHFPCMCVIRVFVINVKLAEQSEPRPFVGPVMASDMILSEIGLRMSPGPEIKYYSFAWSNQQFWAHYKNLNKLFIMN